MGRGHRRLRRDQAAGGSRRFRAGFPAVRRSRRSARRRALVQCHVFRRRLGTTAGQQRAPLPGQIRSTQHERGVRRLPAGGHLRLPCADLGRPPVTLWEQRAATRSLREAGRQNVDEAAIFAAIEEQRRVLAEAQSTSKAARRAAARLPDHRSASTDTRPLAAADRLGRMSPMTMPGCRHLSRTTPGRRSFFRDGHRPDAPASRCPPACVGG